VFLECGFTAEGAGDHGAVRLDGARIVGSLTVTGATLRNSTGPALHADGLQIDGHVLLEERFIAEGAGDDGAVRLHGARIGGQLSLRGAVLRNPSGPALHAETMQTNDDVFLDEGFTAEGAESLGTIRLLGGRVGGQLHLAGGTVINTTNEQLLWAIDGLTYSGVPQLAPDRNREAWLKLLRTGTIVYAAQPYLQLAAVYRAEGHDSDTRAILMAQREDQLARGGLSMLDRSWARLTGVLLGYGHQPWRAFIALARTVRPGGESTGRATPRALSADPDRRLEAGLALDGTSRGRPSTST
jgi:hypothetical protein